MLVAGLALEQLYLPWGTGTISQIDVSRIPSLLGALGKETAAGGGADRTFTPTLWGSAFHPVAPVCLPPAKGRLKPQGLPGSQVGKGIRSTQGYSLGEEIASRTPGRLVYLLPGHLVGKLAWGAEVTFSTEPVSPRAASFRNFRLGDGGRPWRVSGLSLSGCASSGDLPSSRVFHEEGGTPSLVNPFSVCQCRISKQRVPDALSLHFFA